MNIEFHHENEYKFGDLSYGDIFVVTPYYNTKDKPTVYMKISCNSANAVILNTTAVGNVCTIYKDSKVYKVKLGDIEVRI